MFQRRQRWLTHTLLQPVFEMVLEEAWLLGDFDAGADFYERMDMWTRALWVPPGWGWIDPTKESQAWKLALEMGTTTRGKIIAAADGGDFDAITDELADEEATRRARGLGMATQAQPQSSDDEDDDEAQPIEE